MGSGSAFRLLTYVLTYEVTVGDSELDPGLWLSVFVFTEAVSGARARESNLVTQLFFTEIVLFNHII